MELLSARVHQAMSELFAAHSTPPTPAPLPIAQPENTAI
jgi:hypothetical protein